MIFQQGVFNISDKTAFSKHVNWPSAVNNALRILKEINPFYRDKIINSQWQ